MMPHVLDILFGSFNYVQTFVISRYIRAGLGLVSDGVIQRLYCQAAFHGL